MYPGIVSVGGNTGTVNSYTGVDLGDVTGGAFNLDNLSEGNNAACYLLQISQAGLATQALGGLAKAVGQVLGFVTEQLGPLGKSLACPELASLNNGLFQQFPGAADYTG